MCLAIYKPAGKNIPEDVLRMGWNRNSDGGGFAYYHDGDIYVQKGFDKWADFYEAYEDAAEKFPDSKFLIHFRIRSLGAKDADNTHPHEFEHGVAIHNGTLSGTGAFGATGQSDTVLFLKKFGERLTRERVVGHKAEFDDAVQGSKFVLLYKDGEHVILNERYGTWRDGVWYSNQYSIPPDTGTAYRSLHEAYGIHD